MSNKLLPQIEIFSTEKYINITKAAEAANEYVTEMYSKHKTIATIVPQPAYIAVIATALVEVKGENQNKESSQSLVTKETAKEESCNKIEWRFCESDPPKESGQYLAKVINFSDAYSVFTYVAKENLWRSAGFDNMQPFVWMKIPKVERIEELNN